MGDAAENLPELLTIDEVAPLLKIHPKTLYRLIEEGHITKSAGLRRVGPRTLRFYKPALVAWFAGQEGALKGKKHP